MEITPDHPSNSFHPALRFFIRFATRLADCLFLLPVILVPTVFASFNTNTIVMKETVLQFCVAYSIAALPLLWLSQPKNDTKRASLRWPTPVCIVLLLLAAFLLILSQGISPHPRSNHEFLRWVSYIFLALVSIPFAASRRRFTLYLTSTILTAYIIAIYAIGQSFEIDFIYKDLSRFPFGLEGVRRVCGSMGNPDYLGSYLVALIPLTLFSAMAYSGITRNFFLLVSVIESIALVFTYSRGAEAALFLTFGFLVVALILVIWKNPTLLQSIISKKKLFIGFGILLLAGAGFGLFMWDDLSVSIIRISQLGEDTSTITRPMYWRGALAMWMARPLTGFGIGSFPLHFPEFRPQQLAVYQPFKEFYVEHAHNEFLEILSETGTIGFTLYVAFLLITTLSVWRVVTRTSDRENLVLLGLWGGIIATLIHNLFTVTLRFTPSAFLFWSFSGVIIGRATTLIREEPILTKWKKWGLYLIFLAVIPYLCVSACQYFVGDFQIAKAKKWISELNPTESQKYNRELLEKILTALYTSTSLIPDQVESHYLLGLAYHKVYDYPQAREAYERLESLQKDFTSNRLNLAISAMKQSDMLGGSVILAKITKPFPLLAKECLDDSIVWLKRGLESDPTAPNYHHFLGRAYFHLGEFANAEKALRDALKYCAQRPFEYIDSVNPSPDIHSFLGRIYFYQNKFPEAEQEFQTTLQELKPRTALEPAYTRDLQNEVNRFLAEIQKKKQASNR